jgi:hypothetical protein
LIDFDLTSLAEQLRTVADLDASGQVLEGSPQIDYDMKRPHSAHGELTPSEFAKAWLD